MIKQFLSSRLASILILIGIVILAIPLSRIIPTAITNRETIANLEQNLEDLKEKQRQVAERKAYYQSNDYLEQQARLRLNYKKSDEQVVFIYKDSPTPTPKISPKSVSALPKFLQKILDYLSKKK